MQKASLGTVAYILGFIPEPTCQVLSKTLGGILLASDWIYTIEELTGYEQHSWVDDGNARLRAVNYRSNRYRQSEEYRDKRDYPALMKTAGHIVNSIQNEGVWFGVGNFAEVVFDVNYVSAIGQSTIPKNNTRLTKDIGMKVVKSTDGTPVATEISRYSNRVGYFKKGLIIEDKVVVGYVQSELSGRIEIPYGVTAIGNNALSGATFNDIVIPNTVNAIGATAFSGCTGLSQITIPTSVTSIGEEAVSLTLTHIL